MEKYYINNRYYYHTDNIKEEYPNLFKGCKTTKAFVNKHSISNNKYCYARLSDDEWMKSNGSSRKYDKLFVRVNWFNNNFDVEDIKKDIIKDAPPIIELNDEEKFINNKGEIVEIEVRGQREYDQCYFKVKDIMDGFGIKKLHDVILNSSGAYQKNIHYQYFYSTNPINYGKGKIKKLFLTYKGLMRVLCASHKKTADKFMDWAAKILFTVQMGTEHQKNKLIGNILGVSSEAVTEVFNKNAHTMPCIYLFSIGRVRDLRKELGIDDSYGDNDYVYKWGRTRDLERRTKEHNKKYGSLNSSDVKLVLFGFIDPQYTSEAETKLNHLFDGMDMKLDSEYYNELAIIPKKKMKLVKEQYETISKAYLGHVTELIQIIKQKDNEIMLIKEQHKNELLIEKHRCGILEKELEIANLKLSLN